MEQLAIVRPFRVDLYLNPVLAIYVATSESFTLNTTSGAPAFASYQLLRYGNNPTTVNFTVESSCNVTLKGTYTCGNACTWTDVSSGPDHLNISFSDTLTQCGCAAEASPNATWLLRVDNVDSVDCSVVLHSNQQGWPDRRSHRTQFLLIPSC